MNAVEEGVARIIAVLREFGVEDRLAVLARASAVWIETNQLQDEWKSPGR